MSNRFEVEPELKDEDVAEAGAPFHGAARMVRRRLFVCRWLAAIRSSSWVFAGSAIAITAGARWGGAGFGDFGFMAGAILAWVAGCGGWASLRPPSAFGALALWDERADRKEAFASAYFFECKKEREASEGLHWAKSLERLETDRGNLNADLPLPRLGGRWALPFLLMAFAISPFLKASLEAGDVPLSEEMVEEARKEADKLAVARNPFEKMKSLTEEEQREIEKLRQEVNAAAEELKDSKGKSSREVLQELEKRARAAEELAEQMGGPGDEWASEEMLLEMSQHADTADLADPIKDREAERSAVEADRVAERLRAPDLSNEVEERITTALSRVMEQAQPEDLKRPVGRDVGAASEDMGKDKPEMAAKDFKRLADHFRHLAERERAQEKLRELAEELRKAGSNIAGKNLESMEKLAGNQGSSMKPMEGLMSPDGQSLTPMNQNLPNMGQSMPMPGMQPGKAGKGQAMTLSPVPGGKEGKPMALAPGGTPGEKPKGMIMAPIPGTGGGQASLMPGAGGLQAGAGSAPMEKDPTAATAAAQSGLVGAQVNEDGEAAYRAVEGVERSEMTERERQEQVVDFIRVEEEALDEQSLPLSRREHVLRYFTALRERFESQGK